MNHNYYLPSARSISLIFRCKLLSLSQEKYASHVVEKALEHAAPPMLKEMMEEIFDGYVPHPYVSQFFHSSQHFYDSVIRRRMLSIFFCSTSSVTT